MDINKLMAISNDTLWLKLTEEGLDGGTYKSPEKFTYNKRIWVQYPLPSQRLHNAKILQQICIEANHLTEYGFKAKAMGRADHLEKARKKLMEYNRFLELQGCKRENGLFYNDTKEYNNYLKGGQIG
jgi:hypothetical protein